MILIDSVWGRRYDGYIAVKGCRKDCGFEWKRPSRAKELLTMSRCRFLAMRTVAMILAAGVICGMLACV